MVWPINQRITFKAFIERWAWIWYNSKKWKLSILLILLASIGGITCSLLFVNYTKLLIDRAYHEHTVSIGSIFILITYKLLQILLEQGEYYYRTLTRTKLENNLVFTYFSRFFKADILPSKSYPTGDKIYRLSNDASAIAECISSNIPTLIYSIVLFVSTSLYLFFQDARVTLILCLLTPITLIICFFYSKLLIPAEKKVKEVGSEIFSKLQDYFNHHELIVLYTATNFVEAELLKIQALYLTKIKRRLKLIIAIESINEGCLGISYLIVIIWGIWGLSVNTINFGEFVVFLQLTGQMQRPFFLFKDQIASITGSCASIDRLKEIEELKQWVEDKTINLNSNFDSIDLRNVSFSYDKNEVPVISNLNLSLKKGGCVGIIGRSGIGKTSLFKLLLGINTPTEGIIFFKSKDGKAQLSKRTYNNFAYVPQGNSLIRGTVRTNLILANEQATEDEIEEALYLACADFVKTDFQDGLETQVGEKGNGISEGQAQRIALARALLCKRPILLLDEPTSALDPATEHLLMKRLTNLSKERTIIIITHQPKLAEWCDEVIDFDNIQGYGKNTNN